MDAAPPPGLLSQAIHYVQLGQVARARSLLLRVVQAEPDNELAWLWLAETESTFEDRLHALEQALRVNPANAPVQRRYAQLQVEWQAHQRQVQAETEAAQARRAAEVETRLAQARAALRAGRRDEARETLLALVAVDERCEAAWWLLSELVPDVRDQITALENVLTLNPQHAEARRRLEDRQHLANNPLELGKLLEARGQLDQAIEAYLRASVHAEAPLVRAEAARRLEAAQHQRHTKPIRVIAPNLTLARLTAGPVVLYALILFLQSGLNPLRAPPLLALGSLGVILSGFMLTLAGTEPRHPGWIRWFGAPGAPGERLARVVVWSAGAAVLALVYLYFVLSALERLLGLWAQFPS